MVENLHLAFRGRKELGYHTVRITFDKGYMKEKVILEPGEYHTADNDRVIYTILGSCVSVCLMDTSTGIAGMNHFMLPEGVGRSELINSNSGRYGINAMELLINEMLFRGASRSKLVAKVFGGAHVLDTIDSSKIPDSNVEFAILFLEMEGFPVVGRDVGGTFGRKVSFHTGSGKVFVKKVVKSESYNMESAELSYRKRIITRTDGELTLFDRREAR